MATSGIDVNTVDRIDPANQRQTSGSNKLGKDEFLKLLITQLQHQDPTAPADSTAFIAQLAQFSSLEMAQNSSSTLEKLLLGQANQQRNDVMGFVGKDVSFRTDSVELKDGSASKAVAMLEAPANQMTVVVSDPSGRTVRTLHFGAQEAGPMEITWDGRDESGSPAAAGTYSLRVTASDKKNDSVTVTQRAQGRVSGVSLEKDQPELVVGNKRIKLSEIVEIKERSTQ